MIEKGMTIDEECRKIRPIGEGWLGNKGYRIV